MKKIKSHQVGVETGVTHLFSDFAVDGEMWSGEGERTRRVQVDFSESYVSPPAVHIGFALWDISNDANHRVDMTVQNITETCFEIVFTTWGDTKVARLRANWMAVGAVKDDEVWDV